MAALTGNVNTTKKVYGTEAVEIVNAQQVWGGGYQAVGSRDHATAGNQGRQFPWSGVKGCIPTGIAQQDDLGNTTVSPTIRSRVTTEHGIALVNVNGLAGNNTDNKRLVYPTTTDNLSDFTLTRTDPTIPIGWVYQYLTASQCYVEFFSSLELAVLAMAGGGQRTELLGIVGGNIAASADELTNIVLSGHGRITNIYGEVIVALTGAGASLTVQAKLNGTLTTGGAITWVLADAIGAKKQGTALTALNVFGAGDTLNINVVVGTAGTAGLMAIYAQVLQEPGL